MEVIDYVNFMEFFLEEISTLKDINFRQFYAMLYDYLVFRNIEIKGDFHATEKSTAFEEFIIHLEKISLEIFKKEGVGHLNNLMALAAYMSDQMGDYDSDDSNED